jgi:hypothetical protein
MAENIPAPMLTADDARKAMEVLLEQERILRYAESFGAYEALELGQAAIGLIPQFGEGYSITITREADGVRMFQWVDDSKGERNLLFADGKYLYAHTNCKGTMHYLEKEGVALVSTQPLTGENWRLAPFCQLLAFSKGKLIKIGTEHQHEYIQSEEEMKLIYQIFANL